jgi:hypothetical protein
MFTSKTHGSNTNGKQPAANPKNPMTRAVPNGRPASAPKAPVVKPSVQPVRAIPPLPKPSPQPARAQPPLSKPGMQPARVQDPIAKSGAQPARAQPQGARHVQETLGAAHRASSDSSKAKAPVSQATRINAPPASSKGKTPWTVEAAGRVASVTAKKGDGTVKKGSFAADAMSRAMKHERNGSREK